MNEYEEMQSKNRNLLNQVLEKEGTVPRRVGSYLLRDYPVERRRYELVPQKCPRCNSNLYKKAIDTLACSNETCAYQQYWLANGGTQYMHIVGYVNLKPIEPWIQTYTSSTRNGHAKS